MNSFMYAHKGPVKAGQGLWQEVIHAGKLMFIYLQGCLVTAAGVCEAASGGACH